MCKLLCVPDANKRQAVAQCTRCGRTRSRVPNNLMLKIASQTQRKETSISARRSWTQDMQRQTDRGQNHQQSTQCRVLACSSSHAYTGTLSLNCCQRVLCMVDVGIVHTLLCLAQFAVLPGCLWVYMPDNSISASTAVSFSYAEL